MTSNNRFKVQIKSQLGVAILGMVEGGTLEQATGKGLTGSFKLATAVGKTKVAKPKKAAVKEPAIKVKIPPKKIKTPVKKVMLPAKVRLSFL